MKKAATYVLGLLLLVQSVMGVGFSIPYMVDQTMKMHQGETQVIPVTIQNGGEYETVFTMWMIGPDEIAYLMDDPHQVMPPYTYNRVMHINVTIPRCSPPGEVYYVSFGLNGGSEGWYSIDLMGGWYVRVLENPEKPDFTKLELKRVDRLERWIEKLEQRIEKYKSKITKLESKIENKGPRPVWLRRIERYSNSIDRVTNLIGVLEGKLNLMGWCIYN